MPERCRFPLCKSWATDNGLCTSHGKYFNTDDFKGVAKAAPSSKPVGRIGKQLLNYKNLMSSCANCNRVCEEKDAEAREKGIKKSQHSIQ